MHTIAELNLLLRVRVELPEGLRLTTEEFRDGWNFSRSLDAPHLERRILKRGWSFVRIGDGLLRSGIGETSQEAIASALKLALRNIGEHTNAVEVANIELTQYPWFFLARVSVYSYRIQKGVFPSQPHAASLPIVPQRGRLPRHSVTLFPHFACAMPELKEMLVSQRSLESRPL